MLTKIEQNILTTLGKEVEENSVACSVAAKAYRDLMEAARCRIDAEMMQHSFDEARKAHAIAEAVAKKVAPQQPFG